MCLWFLLAFSLISLASHPAHAAERLYYFWSFSMPEESLKAAFEDGEKVALVARRGPQRSLYSGLKNCWENERWRW